MSLKRSLKNTAAGLFVLLAFPVAAQAAGGNIEAGQRKAATCVACHGEKGISSNPLWPNLAGQHADYLAKQLKDFREGRRKDPLMTPLAKPLSDEDIQDLAAYFASLEQ